MCGVPTVGERRPHSSKDYNHESTPSRHTRWDFVIRWISCCGKQKFTRIFAAPICTCSLTFCCQNPWNTPTIKRSNKGRTKSIKHAPFYFETIEKPKPFHFNPPKANVIYTSFLHVVFLLQRGCEQSVERKQEFCSMLGLVFFFKQTVV